MEISAERLTDRTARELLPRLDDPPRPGPLPWLQWTVLACPRERCGGLIARLAAAHAEHRDAVCPRCGGGSLERIAGPPIARGFVALGGVARPGGRW